jgi:hypothetical protein
MSFLSPWFLLGLLGVSIPLAIHLIRREKAVKILFSTVRFLKNAPKKTTFTHRFQQWLLMSIRAVIVALLAIAFARPLISGTATLGMGNTLQSTVILLDSSMSMRYGSYFERAKKEALEILRRLKMGDEAAIIAFSDGNDQVKELTTDRADLENFLKTLNSPGYNATRYLPAFRLADRMLSASHYPSKTVYLISDFQRHAYATHDVQWRLGPGIRFEGIQIADKETTNLAVTHVKYPQHLIEDRENHTILAQVQNLGTRSVTSARVSLRINDKTVAAKKIEFRDQAEVEVGFPVTFGNEGLHRGVVSVEDNGLAADNHYYFTTRVSSPVKILCVTNAATRDWYEDDSYWFRLALGKANGSSFELSVVPPQRFDPAALDAKDVIVLLNIEALEPAQIQRIQVYIETGGSLLLAPADRVDDGTFNRLFGALSPAILRNKLVRNNQGFMTITEVNDRHPIFRSLGPRERIDFSGARLWGCWTAEPLKGSIVHMKMDSGAPFLLERKIGNGRVLLFTSSLDTEWNNFPLQPFYLPLIHETLLYLAPQGDEKFSYGIGEPVPLRTSSGKLVRVVDPDGHEVDLAFAPGKIPFYTATRIPGIYAIRAANFKEYIAVNTLPQESDLTAVDPASIGQMIINPDSKPTGSTETSIAVYKAQKEHLQRLWWWLLLMVFILAVGETLLANRTYR